MKNHTVLTRIVGVIVGIAIIGGGLCWLGSRNQTAAPQAADSVHKPRPRPAARAITTRHELIYRTEPELAPAADRVIDNAATGIAAMSDGNVMINKVLTADTDFPNKCKDLLALYAVLPETDKIEIARHICKLSTEEDYADLWEILIDPQTPARVDEVILDDLFNRSDSLTLPLLLQVARAPAHPMAEVAQENLASFLKVDHGTDWAQWELTLQSWLKSH